MASVEHCLFCFEVLAAKLQDRTPMSLYQTQLAWEEYPKGLDEELPTADSTMNDGPTTDGTTSSQSTNKPSKPSPAIQRLLPSTSSSSSSSSLQSTDPSTPSSDPSDDQAPARPFIPTGIGRRTSQRTTNITASPLFVTWNIISARTGSRSLRGCIGTFESSALSSSLASYAITSAMHDTRFNPVTLAELPRLSVDVTLLTDFETCSDAMDWELGVHGLRVSFYHHHRRYGATYLPDVAVEQGWSKEETLVSLMRKAGWSGRAGKWREVGDLVVTRYQGKKETVDWEEYERWRKWVDERKT